MHHLELRLHGTDTGLFCSLTEANIRNSSYRFYKYLSVKQRGEENHWDDFTVQSATVALLFIETPL